MQLFYSKDITDNGFCTLDAEESRHAVRVMRLREGDKINVRATSLRPMTMPVWWKLRNNNPRPKLQTPLFT